MSKDMIKKIAYYGVFTAVAVIIAWIERQIPLPIPIPGVKLGLANVVVVVILYAFNPRWAISISVLRVILVSLLFGGPSAAILALAGALTAFAAMFLVKRAKIFGTVGVSVAGGVVHGIAQILVAMVMLQTPALAYHMPFLMITGVITGVLVGYTAGFALKNITVIQRIGRL